MLNPEASGLSIAYFFTEDGQSRIEISLSETQTAPRSMSIHKQPLLHLLLQLQYV